MSQSTQTLPVLSLNQTLILTSWQLVLRSLIAHLQSVQACVNLPTYKQVSASQSLCPCCLFSWVWGIIYTIGVKVFNKVIQPCLTYPVKEKEHFLANRDSLECILKVNTLTNAGSSRAPHVGKQLTILHSFQHAVEPQYPDSILSCLAQW